jgi:hypothetical protein
MACAASREFGAKTHRIVVASPEDEMDRYKHARVRFWI